MPPTNSPPSGNRVTIWDIAEKAGVHITTVSRALRDHPRIPEATRQRIKAIADSLGYTPDPILSALNAYRKAIRRPHYQATLAWLDNWSGDKRMFNIGEFREYFKGAQDRAATLGYKIEIFHLNDGELSPARFRHILAARNIQGIIMAPQQYPGTVLDLDLTGLCAVSIGYSLHKPTLHVVTNHHFRTILLMLRNLDALGYHRIAICTGNEWDEKVGHNWQAGIMLARTLTKNRLEPTILDDLNPRVITEALRAQPFDAIVGYSDLYALLKAHHAKLPPFASLSVLKDDPHFSGTWQNSTLIGSKSVDLLVDLIHRNETGVPEYPTHTLIDSLWKIGKTLPPRHRQTAGQKKALRKTARP